jgi:septal ring factor EnvC (AmiA/AmiB activator)
METVSWTYVLLSLGSIALISGAVLGYLFGFRAGGRRERFIQVKEKLKRNKAVVFKQQKERYEYQRLIKQLEAEMLQLTSESELYKERMADLEFYQQKLRESERIIASLSDESKDLSESTSLSLLVQMKEDPLHANLTRTEWNEVFHLTDMLFNHVLTVLKEKYAITRHEQEICCLVKWNFSRKEQLAVFNNTSEALTKSKNRLKKKLQLDEKSDLDTFIRLF